MENLVKPTIKFALALCEILVYGNEENRDKMKMMLDKLQHQINKSKTNKNKVRILWYLGEENKTQTIEEKKEWLINESNCVFYVFAPNDYKIPDNYIANLMIGVNMFDRSLGLMRKEGVTMKKKKKDNEAKIDYEPFEILD